MSTYPSLPLFTDAFIADTGHLSALETGAYLMLLMMAWRQPDCRLPDDDARLSRWARVDGRTWKRIKGSVMEFWALENGFWSQGRLSKERSIVSKRAEVARENGKHGGRPNSLNNNDEPNPVGSVQGAQKKAPNPNPTKKGSKQDLEPCPKRVRTYPDDFEKFWLDYPTDANMSKKEAFDVWKKLTPENRKLASESLPSFKNYCATHKDYRPVHACRYLAKERYTGHVAVARGVGARQFIEAGTPQWSAWQEYFRATKGVGSPTTQKVVGGLTVNGWNFESEWPPAGGAHGTAH